LKPASRVSEHTLVATQPGNKLVGARNGRRDLRVLIPWVLALIFCLWSLRTIDANNVVDTDAARHAMNGAFLRDSVASGNLSRLVAYGREYYGRYPALSLPYHPPLFPALEALFFGFLGVNFVAARALVTLSVVISVLLLYSLILKTIGSHWVAVFSVTTFMLWRHSQNVASDVMLEFPCMMFLLGALHCLIPFDERRWFRKAIGFALLSSAALWSKQHALFLGMIPFVLVILQRQWPLLASLRLWIPAMIFGAAAALLAALSLPFGSTGVSQLVDDVDVSWFKAVPWHNLLFYVGNLPRSVGWVPVGLLVATLLLWSLRRFRRDPRHDLYIAWAVSSFFLLLILGPYEDRYLFFVYPPLLVIAYSVIESASGRLLTERFAFIPGLTVALICAAMGIQVPGSYLTGPSEAAAALVDATPHRILYCGNADGNFIFAVRALDKGVKTVVLSGEKLLWESKYSAKTLEELATRYRIDRVVTEHTPRRQLCNELDPSSLSTMEKKKEIPMTSSLARFDGGKLTIYHFNGIQQDSNEQTLKMEVPKIGSSVDIKF